MECINWGMVEYAEAWSRQTELFNARIEAKKNKNDLPDLVVLCEHPPVYTLGKSGAIENLLASNQMLIDRGVSFFKTDRGGDITYHGPGQIVGYPIFDLEHFKIGLRQYLYNIEESVILFLKEFNVKGERLEGATGVWIDVNVPGATRKISAMGVKSSHFVTMHGLALNINTDLSYFQLINPCGFTNKGVTSLSVETGQVQDMDACRQLLFEKMAQVFNA
ncbi:MAG TPA: lipoyl(octanoyl) transferase LipB [Bacteroidales bacterium]|nr:lipoyl(octanoyl) transferase LipB [Bacteroidales bacterium]